MTRLPRAFTRLLLAAFAALLLVASVGGATPRAVEAHANLEEADPAQNTSLDAAPDAVTLRFTEPVATGLSDIRVLNSNGERVDRGDVASVGGDLFRLRVSLPPDLPDGTYTVAWRNVSTVDGHSRSGWYAFAVGVPLDPDAAVAQASDPLFQSPFDPIVRAAVLIGALGSLGALLFTALIAEPALRRERRLRDAASRPLRRLHLWALALWLVATAVQLPVQAAISANVPVHRFFEAAFGTLLLDTDWGRAWVVRAALLVGALATLPASGRRGPGRLLHGALLVGALLSISAASHSAALTGMEVAGAVNDATHLLAAAAWAGGLAGLFVTAHALRGAGRDEERREALSRIVPRFSLLAVVSTAVLVATGLYASWLHVHVIDALSTTYGRVLLLKVALVAGLVALGAMNLLRVGPELRRTLAAAATLRRNVRIEVVLAALVVLAVGVMTSIEPGRTAAIDAAGGPTFESETEGAQVELQVQPAEIGSNRLLITLRDGRGEPIDSPSVQARITYAEQEIGEEILSAEPIGNGRYEVPAARISVEGEWTITVEALRDDGFDIRTTFGVPVGADVAAAGGLPLETARWLWLAQWVALGAAGLLGAQWLRGPRRGATQAAGSVALVLGSLALFGSPLRFEAPPPAGNPIPASATVLERGRALYADHCTACHGMEGYGDGPQADDLPFQPADLVLHVPNHSDRELFETITEGVPDRGMPAWGDELSEEQRWSLVHALRELAQQDEEGAASAP